MAIRDELRPVQFKVVSLVYGKAITQAEAATRLGRSPSTISEHIKNAESTLAEARRQAIASNRASDLARLFERLGIDLSVLKLDDPDSG